jgi:predicted metal-binding membrane protein
MRALFAATRSAVTTLGGGSATPGWTIVVVGLAIAAWVSMLATNAGMDQGPGTPLHNLPMFLTAWVVMLTAMMLPSELNYIGAYGILLRGRGTGAGERHRRIWSFILGYGVAWLAYGLAAYFLDSVLRAVGVRWIMWKSTGPYLVASTLVLAAAYQLSPLKHACLKGCRSPLSFFSRYWRQGDSGAVSMGLRHGMVCVGCCWALMAVMFAVGAMSLPWMAALTLFMFAEKMLPIGRALTVPIACVLVSAGIWIAASPSTAPLIKLPPSSAHVHSIPDASRHMH